MKVIEYLKNNRDLIILLAILLLVLAIFVVFVLMSDTMMYDIVCPYCGEKITIIERIK